MNYKETKWLVELAGGGDFFISYDLATQYGAGDKFHTFKLLEW